MVVLRPWIHQVVVITAKGEMRVTDAGLIKSIATQSHLNPEANWVVAFRLKSIQVWQEVPVSGQVFTPLAKPLVLRVQSIPGESNIIELADVGTTVRFARIGYTFPAFMRQVVFQNATSDQLFTVSPSDTDQTWLCHVALEWTCREASQTTVATL